VAGSILGVIMTHVFGNSIVSWTSHVWTWKEVKREECNGHKILVLDLCIENYQGTVGLGLASR
jgi:hypothetical protein